MRPGVQEIAPGLYQAAFADAVAWTDAPLHVDVAVIMCGGALPSLKTQIELTIDDNANGCPVLPLVQDVASLVAHQRVLSVCHVGENRSGLLSALILIKRGLTPQAAITIVQTRGPHNSPTQPHSFWNSGFVRQVAALPSSQDA